VCGVVGGRAGCGGCLGVVVGREGGDRAQTLYYRYLTMQGLRHTLPRETFMKFVKSRAVCNLARLAQNKLESLTCSLSMAFTGYSGSPVYSTSMIYLHILACPKYTPTV
jgi:hypothetical protein